MAHEPWPNSEEAHQAPCWRTMRRPFLPGPCRLQAVCKGRRQVLGALLKHAKELEGMVDASRRPKPELTPPGAAAARLQGPGA